MAVNRTVDSFSNCTFQCGSNFSGDPFYQCMDSNTGNYIFYFVAMLNVLFVVPLNCWILWLVRRNRSVAWSDFAILNQSVNEVIAEISLCVFPLVFFFYKKALILMAIFLCSTFLVGRPLFQTYFCVERYLAVVHPLLYLKYSRNPKMKVSLVGLFWLIILFFGWYSVDSYPKMATWFYIGMILAMLVVCSSCSVMILWVLKRPKPGDERKEGAYQLKRKAFVSVTVILMTLVFGYGTISCVIALRDQLPYHFFCLVIGLSWFTLLPSAAVQPFLYLSKINRLPCIRNV